MARKPSLGRIVHYQSYGTPGDEYPPEPRAAIITAVEQQAWQSRTATVSLCVLNPAGMLFNQLVPFSETPKPGHWNWPPRVED